MLEEAQTSIQKNFEKGRLGYQANMQSVKVGDQIGELNLNFKDAIYEESKVLHEAAIIAKTEYITQEEGQALTLSLMNDTMRCSSSKINYIVMQTIRTKQS